MVMTGEASNFDDIETSSNTRLPSLLRTQATERFGEYPYTVRHRRLIANGQGDHLQLKGGVPSSNIEDEGDPGPDPEEASAVAGFTEPTAAVEGNFDLIATVDAD